MSEIEFESEVEEQPEPEQVEKPEEPEAEQPEEPKAEGERPANDGNTEDEDPWRDYNPNFDEKQNEFINQKIVGKHYGKRREAEEKLEAERLAREKAERELMQLKEPQRPEVPPIPDPYDDNFEAKMAEREQAIAAQAVYDRDKAAREYMTQLQQKEAQEKAQQEFVQSVTTYSERAKNLGISPVELEAAGDKVARYGVSDDIVNHILHDKQGPQVTMYLAKNPLEVEKLQTMIPTQAAVYIETQIKPKAIVSKAKPDDTPEPVDTPNGKGMPEAQRGPKNATYE